MKRLFGFVLLIAFSVVFALSFGTVGTASAAEVVLAQFNDPYTAMEYYSSHYVDRTDCTDAEKAAAYFLAENLVAMGYVGKGGQAVKESMIDSFTFRTADPTQDSLSALLDPGEVEYSSQNVVAYKRSGTANAPLLIIASYYGNGYKIQVGDADLGYQDVYSIASSVGAMLALAKKLSLSNWAGQPYDIAFIFWGAGYYGYYAAEHFVATNAQPILGYIEIDAIGGGDNLNLYCDEVATEHESYLAKQASRYGYELHTKPFNPGYASGGYALPYSHLGLSGNNVVFMAAGVPSAYLFGYNWAGGLNNAESATKASILGTSDDTLPKLIELYGEDNVRARLNTVVNYLSAVVTDTEGVSNAFGSDQGKPAYMAFNTEAARLGFKWSIVGIAVLAIAIMAALLFNRSKKADQPDFSSSAAQTPADGSSLDEDIFGRNDPSDQEPPQAPPTQTNQGDDDIFGEY